MGKTFLLAAVGLTAVLGLGGGALNLLQVEQISPTQLLGIMLIVLPVAGTLTLPVAALYSATATFGRLSADNEFLACRASGINVSRLFLSPAAISVATAACTFYFTSFMIPGLIRDLNTLARAGVLQLVEQRVRSPERLPLPGGRGRLYADTSARAQDDPNAVVLNRFAYVEQGAGGLRRFGTGERAVLRISGDEGLNPSFSGDLYNWMYYDRERGSWVTSEHNHLPPTKIPISQHMRMRWLRLGELIHFRRSPELWPKVAGKIAEYRGALVQALFYERAYTGFQKDEALLLASPNGTVTLEAGEVRRDALREGHLSFQGVRIVDRGGRRVRTITGDEAFLSVQPAHDDTPPEAELNILGNVSIAEGDDSARPIQKGRERIDGLTIPSDIQAEIGAIGDTQLLTGSLPPELSDLAGEARWEALHAAERFGREITSELHSRLAFSVSALVMVLLGAALGIIFRGGNVMVAFGISFVPTLFVTVMNIAGRQLAEKSGTTFLGLAVIWGAILVVGLLDVWAIFRVIRR